MVKRNPAAFIGPQPREVQPSSLNHVPHCLPGTTASDCKDRLSNKCRHHFLLRTFHFRVPYLLSLQTLISLFLFLNSQTSLSFCLLPLSFSPSLPHLISTSTAAATKQEEVVPSFSSPPLPRHLLCCWFDNRLSQVFNVFSESAGCLWRAAALPVGGWQAGE